MKIRRLDVAWIALSLVLIALVVRQWQLLRVVREGSVSTGVAGSRLKAQPALTHGVGGATNTTAPSNFAAYVEKLRSTGCPEPTIREVLAAEFIRERVVSRREALAGLVSTNYWKAVDWAPLFRERRAAEEALAAMLTQTMGPEAVVPALSREWQRAQLDLSLGFLPDARRTAVVEILLRHGLTDDLVRLVSEARPPTRDPEELRLLLEEYDRKKSELGQLLSQEEFELVEMMTSWTGENLRRATAKFQPTAEEFRVIFREWRSHDERLVEVHASGKADPGSSRVFERIQQQLPPERYAEFRRLWWK